MEGAWQQCPTFNFQIHLKFLVFQARMLNDDPSYLEHCGLRVTSRIENNRWALNFRVGTYLVELR